MVRAVDPRRTRKALQRVRRLENRAAAGTLSPWEKTFLEEVGARLEEYGSAFADYAKGAPDEALSRLQGAKLQEISSKARKETRLGKPARTPAPNTPEDGAPPHEGPSRDGPKPRGLNRRAPLRAKRPRSAADEEAN